MITYLLMLSSIHPFFVIFADDELVKKRVEVMPPVVQTASLTARIQQFNQHRNPAILQLKYSQMSKDIFSFFRGTCHLFYQDWPQGSNFLLNTAPISYLCGDLHLQNFGTYKGDNRLTYFDINDFDEAALGPCTWDVARCLCSLLLVTASLGIDKSQTQLLAEHFLNAYTRALADGKARWVERATSEGMIRELLLGLKARGRREFLEQRTLWTTDRRPRRQFRLVNKRLQTVPQHERDGIVALFEQWRQTCRNPEYYRLLDIAYRIAGTGSLGVERYMLLVEGKSSPNQNQILDLKLAQPSSLLPYLPQSQPHWDNEAVRITTIQHRYQGTSPALLTPLVLGADSEDRARAFVLKELQPDADRVNLTSWNNRLSRLQKLVGTLGQIIAWDQLRSSGREDSAPASDLIRFAQDKARWQPVMLEYAYQYRDHVATDYKTFCEAHTAGQFA